MENGLPFIRITPNGSPPQYKGMGVGNDPFEAFRKAKSGTFYKQMKGRDKGDFRYDSK